MRTTALVLLATVLLVGCGPRKETFSVIVKNDTTVPITIGFTKDNGPDQDIFMPPEFLALDTSIDPSKTSWGILLPPGKTADPKQPVTALLDREGGSVYLRVYRGEINLTEILSISRGSPRRLDVVLSPGDSRIVVSEKNGALAATQQAAGK
jgi:hypothetical protein